MENDAWQPIETAPKDGTPFLIVMPDGRRGVAYIDPRCYEGHEFYSHSSAIVGPDPHNDGRASLSMAQHYLDAATHWMPLPNPPQS